MDLIRIIFTEEDVHGIADTAGVDRDIAIERAQSWAKSISETATSLVTEQLIGAIEEDQP